MFKVQANGLQQSSCGDALNQNHTLCRLTLENCSAGTRNIWGEDKSAMINPEVSTPQPVASLEFIRDSTVDVTRHHSPMEQTSSFTTDDKHIAYTHDKIPNTHQGTQKTSRSGHIIRPPKRFRDGNIP